MSTEYLRYSIQNQAASPGGDDEDGAAWIKSWRSIEMFQRAGRERRALQAFARRKAHAI